MSNPEEFEEEIRAVKEAVPEADEVAIGGEFTRYRDEFLVPPKHALRSVIEHFQKEAGMEVNAPKSTSTRPAAKSVERFTDLSSDDTNVTIEVEVVTYVPRMQMVRGEEKLSKPVTLKKIKSDKFFKELALVKQSRLSVIEIDTKYWKKICKMSNIR